MLVSLCAETIKTGFDGDKILQLYIFSYIILASFNLGNLLADRFEFPAWFFLLSGGEGWFS